MKIFEASLNIHPSELFFRINPEPGWMLFDSALQNIPYSKYSIICISPSIIFSYKMNNLKIFYGEQSEEIKTQSPLDIIKKNFCELKEQFHLAHDFDSFALGLAGYFSYDFGLQQEKIKQTNPTSSNLPEIYLAFFDSVLLYNHVTNKYIVISKEEPKKFLDFIFKRLDTKKQTKAIPHKVELISNFTKEEYIETVIKAKKYIESGEVYQVNLSQQFSCKIDQHPIEIYSRLREKNPAQFSALICVSPDQWILSSSPELFVHLNNGKVITKPIKGTTQRGRNYEEDKLFKEKLLNSEKDSAELLMIIDLERNDLGKVCNPGSIKVTSLKKIETYTSVHHLVAEIEGVLEKSKDIFDLLKAMFPGGSITGAPKRRAMEIINELEKTNRGVYTGSIGYISLNGNALFNIAIRTLIYENGNLLLNLGGGIVYDSNPEKEYEETLQKGEAIFKSILET